MSRSQRVIFRAEVTVVIEAPWDPACSIDQVTKQAARSARDVLLKLGSVGKVSIAPTPRLVRVILDEEVTP